MENEIYLVAEEKTDTSMPLSRFFKNGAVFLGSLLLLLIVALIEAATHSLSSGEMIQKLNITILIVPPVIGYSWANLPFESIRNFFNLILLIIFTVIFNLFAVWALLIFMGIPLM